MFCGEGEQGVLDREHFFKLGSDFSVCFVLVSLHMVLRGYYKLKVLGKLSVVKFRAPFDAGD